MYLCILRTASFSTTVVRYYLLHTMCARRIVDFKNSLRFKFHTHLLIISSSFQTLWVWCACGGGIQFFHTVLSIRAKATFWVPSKHFYFSTQHWHQDPISNFKALRIHELGLGIPLTPFAPFLIKIQWRKSNPCLTHILNYKNYSKLIAYPNLTNL